MNYWNKRDGDNMVVTFQVKVINPDGRLYFFPNKEYEVVEETEHALRMMTEQKTLLFIPKLNENMKIKK